MTEQVAGWGAQGTDRSTRVAQTMITYLQKVVIRSFQITAKDPFAEDESLRQFEDFLCEGHSPGERTKHLKLLVRLSLGLDERQSFDPVLLDTQKTWYPTRKKETWQKVQDREPEARQRTGQC